MDRQTEGWALVGDAHQEKERLSLKENDRAVYGAIYLCQPTLLKG